MESQAVYEIQDPRDGATYEVSQDHPPTPEEARTAIRKFRALDRAKSAPSRMAPPGADDPVTLGDLLDNPAAALGRAGSLLGRDLTDPRTLAGLVASYVGPKVIRGGINLARSAPGAVIRGTAAAGDVMHPDLIGIVSPRAGRAVEAAQRIRGAMSTPAEPVPVEPVPAATATTKPLSPLEVTRQARAAHRATAAPAEAAAAPSTPPPAGPQSAAPPPTASPQGTVPGKPRMPPGILSPTHLQSELGMAARRAKVRFSEEQYQQATELVMHKGKSPAEAVAAVAQATKPKMTGVQVAEYLRLRKQGMSDRDAAAAVQGVQRAQGESSALSQLPTDAEMRARIANRNRTGRWDAAPGSKLERAKREGATDTPTKRP